MIDHALVDWSRAQFALTAMYHWIFVPLTLGLSFILAFMESIYVKTGKEEWKNITQFWMKIFAINFAIGVATGLIMEFEFGTNWSNYSWMVGDIFGAPLAIEGIMAFFIEATFFAVMFFGWNRVSKKFHLFSTWMVAIGSNLSALWILVANAWMNHPVGMEFNVDTARSEMINFWEVLFSPMASAKFIHTIFSSFVYGSLVVVGISAWYLLKKRHIEFAKKSILVAGVFGLICSVYLGLSGDDTSKQIAKHQPMKLAAMEGLYEGKQGAGLVAFGVLNPAKKIDNNEKEFLFKVEIPKLLSVLSYNDPNAWVSGMNDIVKGNPAQGIVSTQERMNNGKVAVEALAMYKSAKKEGNDTLAKNALAIYNLNKADFGYGHIESPDKVVPPVGLTFYSFHIMIALGGLFIVFLALIVFYSVKHKLEDKKWLQKIAIACIPLGLIASMSGWIVAEVGRQPWAIQDLLPVGKATSNIDASNVKMTFFIFAIFFTVLLFAEIKIILNTIKTGPKGE